MQSRHRAVVLVVLTSALWGILTGMAWAQEETDETTTTVTEESGVQPAVPADDAAPEEPLADWTYRYLIPTGIVIAALVVVVTAIQYFTRVVRKRYRIIEE